MKLKLSNENYDTLSYIAQILLPALATLYVTIAGIWGLPYAEAVSGTIMAVDFFLGTLLKISSNQYFSTRSIVTKIMPDDGEDESEGIE